MRPITSARTNRLLQAEGYIDLPVHKAGGRYVSYWAPDPEELAALCAGVPLRLTILGDYHPPVELEVEAL